MKENKEINTLVWSLSCHFYADVIGKLGKENDPSNDLAHEAEDTITIQMFLSRPKSLSSVLSEHPVSPQHLSSHPSNTAASA